MRNMMIMMPPGGALAAIIMTPVDVVKTRLMTQQPDASGALPYGGILQCLMKVCLGGYVTAFGPKVKCARQSDFR